jgi:hypothetical protein
LTIPAKISENEFIRPDDPQEALFTATMLNVRPAIRIHRAHVKAIATVDESDFIVGEHILVSSTADSLLASVVVLLCGEHIGGEHLLHEVSGHNHKFAKIRLIKFAPDGWKMRFIIEASILIKWMP